MSSMRPQTPFKLQTTSQLSADHASTLSWTQMEQHLLVAGQL